jgi:hypothetical protein
MKVNESDLKVNESYLKVTWMFNERMNVRILLSWMSEVVYWNSSFNIYVVNEVNIWTKYTSFKPSKHMYNNIIFISYFTWINRSLLSSNDVYSV